MEYSIDKETITKTIYFGYAKPMAAPVYEWQLPYEPNFKGREYNPEKARKLLAEAGYPKGFETTIYCQFPTCGNDSDAIKVVLYISPGSKTNILNYGQCPVALTFGV